MRHAAFALLAAAKAFFRGELLSTMCPFGSRSLDEPLCEEAATSLGLTYSGAGAYLDFPPGCFEWKDPASPGSAGVLFFNTRPGQAAESPVICLKGSYYLDEPNRAECSPGLTGIGVDACQAAHDHFAGTALTEPFGSVGSWANYPQGCFQFTGPGRSTSGRLYFNEAGKGRAHQHAKLVCQDSFALAPEGTSVCEEVLGLSDLSVVECSIAAANLGYPTFEELSPPAADQPKGCFRENQDALRFNGHATGNASAGSTAACKPLYVSPGSNLADCSSGEDMEPISSEGACISAAQAMGDKYGGAGEFAHYPFGCFSFEGVGIFYNEAFGYKADAQSSPICTRTPAAATVGA